LQLFYGDTQIRKWKYFNKTNMGIFFSIALFVICYLLASNAAGKTSLGQLGAAYAAWFSLNILLFFVSDKRYSSYFFPFMRTPDVNAYGSIELITYVVGPLIAYFSIRYYKAANGIGGD
jgi:hypothetical protein